MKLTKEQFEKGKQAGDLYCPECGKVCIRMMQRRGV